MTALENKLANLAGADDLSDKSRAQLLALKQRIEVALEEREARDREELAARIEELIGKSGLPGRFAFEDEKPARGRPRNKKREAADHE